MRKGKQTPSQQDGDPPTALNRSAVDVLTKFRKEETERWKKRIRSLIYVGFLFSIVGHIILFTFLSLPRTGDEGNSSPGAITTIEFAILDSENFTELPTADSNLIQDVAETQVTSETLDATEAALDADDSPTKLQTSTNSMTPSLSGSGS